MFNDTCLLLIHPNTSLQLHKREQEDLVSSRRKYVGLGNSEILSQQCTAKATVPYDF